MKRSMLVLPGIFAALIVLLAWGKFTSPANSAPAPSPDQITILDNQASETHPGWQWTLEEVDPYKTFDLMTDRSLALDAAGHPHLAYGQINLTYARYDGLSWHFKVVDSAENVGSYAALALDDNDLPHISYYDQTHGDLRYAHFDGSTWVTATVDSAGDVGQHTSIAVDAAGHPHISYYDVANTGLKYASFDGSAWVIEPVDGAGEMGQFTSLALDDSGLPHIAYYGSTHLKYAHYTGASWQILTVDPSNLVGKYASIALDGANHPHIGYYDETNQDLKYAYYDGATWQKQSVDTEGDLGAHTSLALDSTNRPSIAYFASEAIKIAHFDGADWQFEDLAGFGSNQTALSLALNSSDHPTLVVAQSPQLRVFTFAGSGWQNEMVDYAGYTGRYADIVLDENDRPQISYCTRKPSSNPGDSDDCDYLKIAAFDGLDWQIAIVDRGGYHVSLALDSTGKARISYMDALEHDTLKYAYFDGASWQVEAIDALASSNYSWDMYTSLALDSADLPHISYCGYIPYICGELRYARFDGAQWITATVDSVGAFGKYNSIALDDADLPHISYGGGINPNQHLKHAFFDGGAWLTEIVDTGGYAVSQALDEHGHPQIIHGNTGNALKFATFDGYAWQLETVFSGLSGSMENSLAINSAGQPHFSYIDLHSGVGWRLKYALKDDSGWHNEFIVYLGNLDNYGDLALDTQDRPHISYGGQTLKYAYLTPIPLSGASIQGPQIVGADQNNVYSASTTPLNALEPITITWSNGSSGPTAVYSWDQQGTYPISVTVRNPVGLVTDTMMVTVQNMIFLPVVYGPPLIGDLHGGVYDSGTSLAIQGATVCVWPTGPCGATDSNGLYNLYNIPIGWYSVSASAGGYQSGGTDILITLGPSNELNFYLTSLQQYGSVSGQVVSAVTAQGIGGASVCLASGSPCTSTDGSGNYTLSNVPTGAQTVRASAGGYTSLDQGVTVNANQTAQSNFVLSPSLAQGEMRIVLTWGANPRDLDSHLWLPSSHPYHVYWNHKGSCSADPYTCLDVDDRQSYGPETITIKQRFGGTYRYAVYNYSNDATIIASGAHIQVYDSTGLIGDYYVPTSGDGRWWYVFDLDGNSGAITFHNTIMTSSPEPY